MIDKLLIATNNAGKIEEISDILGEINVQLVLPDELQLDLDVSETGQSYLENARQKAVAFCEASGLPSLADDTGLEVAALEGAPGLHSKRYSPDPLASDAHRRNLLLTNLAGKPRPWYARFVCAVVLALPDGITIQYESECEGEIIPEERGDFGFGYDRIFLFSGVGKTMAELEMKEKNRISHRAKAVRGILPYLEKF